MSRIPARRALVTVVAALAVFGAGAAVAASTTGPNGSSFLDSVAKHLGISSQKLQDAVEAAALDQVDQALADGRITRDQADALKARIQSGAVPPRGFGFGPGFAGPGLRGVGRVPGLGYLAAAADFLGLTRHDLLAKIAAGQSLAQVAKDRGKPVDGLEQAIVDAARKRLDQAVAEKRLTSDQEQAMLDRLPSAVADLVNRVPSDHPFLRPRAGGGMPGERFRFGAGPGRPFRVHTTSA